MHKLQALRRHNLSTFAPDVSNFGTDAKDILQNETRLRLEGGTDWSSVNGMHIGFNGFIDGIESGDLESYGFRFSPAGPLVTTTYTRHVMNHTTI